MRKNIENNIDYIVNLTRSIVGKSVLEGLSADFLKWEDGKELFVVLEKIITPKIEKMNAETIGRVCGYGTPQGLHSHQFYGILGFINHTGYMQVLKNDFTGAEKTGLQLLQEIAVATIVCFARDIILQAKWLAEQADEEHNKEYEHGWDEPLFSV